MIDLLSAAQMACAACGDLAFALALGSLAAAACLTDDMPILRRVGHVAVGVLAASHLLALWLEAASMSGAPFVEAQPYLWPVLSQTHFGASWLIGAVGLAGMIGLDALLRGLPTSRSVAPPGRARRPCRRARARDWLMLAGLSIYAFGKAGSGHAADGGDLGLPEMVQWVHLGATALWSGSVIAGALFVAPRLVGATASAIPASSTHWARFAERLSILASAALVVLLATGVFNALHDLRGTLLPATAMTPSTAVASAVAMQPGSSAAASASPGLLELSPYARVLTLKVLLVLLAIGLGTLNRLRYLPRLWATGTREHGRRATGRADAAERGELARADATRRFIKLLRAEALVLALVLVVAAVLGHTAPS